MFTNWLTLTSPQPAWHAEQMCTTQEHHHTPVEARLGLNLATAGPSDSEPPVRCEAASSPSGEARRLSLLLRLDLRPARLATPPADTCAE
jgi:hypothetical protein